MHLIQKYIKPVGYLLGALIALGAIFAGYSQFSQKNEMQWQAQYQKIESNYLKLEADLKAKNEDVKAELLDPMVTELQTFIQNAKAGPAQSQAVLLISELQQKKGQIDEALANLKANMDAAGPLSTLIKLRYLGLLNQKGQFQEVVDVSKSWTEDPRFNLFKPEVLTQRALAFQGLNQLEQAQQALQAIQSLTGESYTNAKTKAGKLLKAIGTP